MNSRILLGVLVLAYVGYRVYDVWSKSAFDLVPTWQWVLWAALVCVSLLQIARGLPRSSQRS